MSTTPEPKGKLDAMTTRQAAKSAGSDVVVNGPEDQTLDWHAVDWHAAQENVRRLRQRIFTASQAGDLKKGPQSAEADAPIARQHAAERAAGDGDQCRP